ncbi:unnamed protein product [Colletotrichum noveboracense]|uniref:CENP-V/GFA domain-containing protein n=1 Tax=Colletotrichum noveboracense TaxID=2664923 RepID=A0A9W4S2Z3_9PEZI|nr:hypothetical protein K456DRAFT_1726608 [Colletotrichum gloeosporioides 23]KAJ0275204.1 hypothetical protein COL940_008931 [Colletotrichum noveboracense]CAI0651956.1 unnamed protein product [Colletotrichum noveboracense]
MATTLTGRCVCAHLQYSAKLASTDDARTSLCHCSSCKRAFGTNYGLTTKVRGLHAGLHSVATIRGGALMSSHGPRSRWKASPTRDQPKEFKQDNGVVREFCDTCGAFVCEYGEAAADKFRYVMWGTFDEPDTVPPKGEFFCAQREAWMPKVDGVFHKQEIKQ